MVPPGVVASPDFSAEPAVPAPWLLALPGEGAELPVVVPVAPFFIAAPPPVVLPFMESPVVVLLAAGPPAAELPPAVLPPLCANAAVPETAKAMANAMVVSFIFGAVAGLVGIECGVVSGVINLESSGVEASDWRPRHDEHYHEA